MKKQLLGTSAIVAASLGMGTVAFAQAPAAPAAPQPVSITINGYVGQYISWADQGRVSGSSQGSVPGSTCTNCSSPGHFDMIADQRLVFNGRARLDEGLTVGVQLEINGGQSGSSNYAHNRGGNAYLDFASFGRVTLGTQTMMARSMISNAYSSGNAFPTGAPMDVFGRTGMVDGGQMHGVLINPTGSSGTNATFNGVTGDMVGDSYTNKIQYLTPRIFGFQLGLGWAPENSKDFNGTGETISKDGGRATHRNGISAAVNYVQNFAGIDVAAGFGYITWLDAPNKTIAGLSAGSAINDGDPRHSVPEPQQFVAGAAIGYAGFKIGAGWGKISDARGLQTNLTEFTGTQQFRASPLNSSLINIKGSAWSVGASYSFGPAAISVNYLDATNNDCPLSDAGAIAAVGATGACNGRDKFSAVGASGSYTIGPGVSLTVGGFYGKYRGNNYNNGALFIPTATNTTTSQTNAAQSNDGGGVIGGILVRF